MLEGPTAKFAVGNASGNYMRFNHTAGILEVNTPNFSISNDDSVVVQGSISVVNSDGSVVNLGDGAGDELFNAMIPPSAGSEAPDGNPVDFFSAYGNASRNTFGFTDLNDGNGRVLDIYDASDNSIGVATKAIPVDSRKYTIRITLKGSGTYTSGTTGLYLRIYETDSTLSSTDKFITLNSKLALSETVGVGSTGTHYDPDSFGGASWYRVCSAGVGQGSNGDRINLSGTYWPIQYTTYVTTYEPTNGTTAFSLNILNWKQ